jgi:predicted cupin superfamily sugar epimerase/mannose-6-phosphate isomerase-like protein (cupin superfamily)
MNLLAAICAALPVAVTSSFANPPTPDGMAAKLIEHYHMQRIPREGAWFSQTYASADQIDGAALPPRYAKHAHPAGSAIVLVATPTDFSALHRLQTDEVWHFYGGAPLDMLLLYPDGHGRKITIGPDALAGEFPQFTVPRGVWQGAAPNAAAAGTYSFAGTQLSPGFEFDDFEIGYRDALQREFPQFSGDIERLTRAEFAARPPANRAVAFTANAIPSVTVSSGVDLRELVGRVARDARTSAVSVAQFTLAPGRGSGTSFNHQSEEVFLVFSGDGSVRLADETISVSPGSTVYIPAGVRHSIAARAGNTLVFYAISAPAFAAEDYVAIKP